MRKILSIILTIVMLLSVAGCGSNPEVKTSKAPANGKPAEVAKTSDSETTKTSDSERPTTSSKDTNSLTLALGIRLNTLDPAHNTLTDEGALIGYIYQSLFFLDKNSNVVLCAAESMTPAEDGSYVEFKLKDDLKFASGDSVTADDIEYSIQKSATSASAAVVGMYTTFEKIDELTFRLNFVDPVQVGFDALASYIMSVFLINKSYCEEKGYAVSDDMLFDCDGSGPFMLDSINEANGDITLKKNPNYAGEVGLDSMYCKVITGDKQLAFEAGEIDMCSYSPVQYKSIANLTNVANKYNVDNYTGFLILNCAEGFPTNDINVRLGLAYALNREDIALVATDGAGEPAYNMCNPTVIGYADVCEHYERDVEKSRQLLSAAGYSEANPYELELITVGAQQAWVDACQIVKENLEESYVKVTITQLIDTTRYFQADFDMGILGITLTTSVTSYAMMFDSQQMNLASVPEEVANPIIAACAAGTTEETAQEAMKMIADSMAYYPVYYTSSYLCYDDRLDLGPSYDEIGGIMIEEISWK